MSTRLENLVHRARDVGVRADHARAYVDELARWASVPARPRRTWVPWLAGAFAVAAALIIWFTRGSAVAPASEPLALGDRVAIIAEPHTTYRVARATADETVVDVEHGTITARLWPGAAQHRLVLRGGAIEAVATGTVYSLTVDDGRASVAVHEGKVAVTGAETATVVPGEAWPRSAPVHGGASATRLLATARPVAPPVRAPDAAVVIADAAPPVEVTPVDAVDAAPRDTRIASDAAVDAPVVDAPAAAMSLTERWRLARLYRGQASYDAAVRECIAIADAKDRTWSPIALVEAIRIELGPLTSPERALALADRFVREWPNHDLAADARALRCRALRQLGRGTECAQK